MTGAHIQILDAFQAGLLSLTTNWSFFLCLGMMQFIFATLTARILGEIPTGKDVYFVLCFLGGTLLMTLFCVAGSGLKIQPTPSWNLGLLVATLVTLAYHRHKAYEFSSTLLQVLVLFFIVLLIFRVSFVHNLIVPSYADSVTHVQIVQDLMNPERPPTSFFRFGLNLQHYYHIGFHSVAAWVSGLTRTDPVQGIMLLGQYFQTLAVLGLYPLGRLASKKPYAAWTAMILVSFFLPMPAYASNWGKYPAIASMVGIAFVLAMLLFHLQKPQKQVGFWGLAALAIISTIILHSRSVNVFVLTAFIYIVDMRLNRLNYHTDVDISHGQQSIPSLFMGYMLIFSLFLLLILEISPGLPIFVLLIALAMIVFFIDAVLASSLVLFLFISAGALTALLAEIGLPERYSLAFDRPYLVILLYIPISILIEQAIHKAVDTINRKKMELIGLIIVFALCASGIIYSNYTRNYLPSPCCVFVNDDDLFSYAWMNDNIPQNSLVGVAATGKSGNLLFADGGAWIEYFTDISTRKLDTNADFVKTKGELCKAGVEYFYLDNLENSFDEYNLIEAGGIHQFGLGTIRIYSFDCAFLNH